jgi:hypothetical protein
VLFRIIVVFKKTVKKGGLILNHLSFWGISQAGLFNQGPLKESKEQNLQADPIEELLKYFKSGAVK